MAPVSYQIQYEGKDVPMKALSDIGPFVLEPRAMNATRCSRVPKAVFSGTVLCWAPCPSRRLDSCPVLFASESFPVNAHLNQG